MYKIKNESDFILKPIRQMETCCSKYIYFIMHSLRCFNNDKKQKPWHNYWFMLIIFLITLCIIVLIQQKTVWINCRMTYNNSYILYHQNYIPVSPNMLKPILIKIHIVGCILFHIMQISMKVFRRNWHFKKDNTITNISSWYNTVFYSFCVFSKLCSPFYTF